QFAEPKSAVATGAKKKPSGKPHIPAGKVSIDDLRRLLGIESEEGGKNMNDEQSNGNTVNKTKDKPAAQQVSWQTYTKLFDVILEAETIERALSMLVDAKRVEASRSSSNKDDDKTNNKNTNSSDDVDLGATRQEFARALRAAKLSLSAEDIEVFYKIFDADGSGTIDPEEFGAVCRLRNNFYAAYVPRYDEPKRNPVQAFVYCMQQRE
ncbi:calcium-binding protein, putative, partial [Bodo saltans]